MQVVGNRVLVHPDSKQTATNSGLILPQQSQEDSQIGTVVGVGDGEYHEKSGRWMPIISVDPGDRVLYSRYGGTLIEVNGEEHLLLSPSDIFAIVSDE